MIAGCGRAGVDARCRRQDVRRVPAIQQRLPIDIEEVAPDPGILHNADLDAREVGERDDDLLRRAAAL
jgi:hypothetical protein